MALGSEAGGARIDSFRRRSSELASSAQPMIAETLLFGESVFDLEKKSGSRRLESVDALGESLLEADFGRKCADSARR